MGLLGILAFILAGNIFAEAQLADVRVDLTQQRLYTLSPGTVTILRGLREPITLRLFYSRTLGARIPQYGAYADRVQELLREYAQTSAGMVRVETFDPEPFSDTEDRAVAYGLQGVPIDQGGDQVYFGLAGTNLLDDERTIGFFQPERERFLEYDLSRLVYELSNPTRPIIGVMSSLPLDGDPRAMMMAQNPAVGAPWVAALQLRQAFTVRNVTLDTPVIDPDIQVLLVAQAQNLSEATQYAIDQFVMRGGRLMLMVDPLSVAQQAQANPQTGPARQDLASSLPRLMDRWGVVFDPKQVVGDLTGAWRIRARDPNTTRPVDFVAWFNIRDGINHDDPATADLAQVTVAAPGALVKKAGAEISFTPLLTSSAQSGLVPYAQLTDDPDPSRILADFKPAGGGRVIAARIRGVLHSAFDGAPKLADGQTRPDGFPAHIGQTSGPANLVVVADSDILADRFWVRMQDFFGQQQATPFSDNGPFVANLIGTLAGGDALIGLRSRGSANRPFTLVEDMQRDAEARFRQNEQLLQTHLDETTKKLSELRTGRGTPSANAVISEQQRAAVDDLKQDIQTTRSRLRSVQLDLRRDIAGLETRLRLFNIAMVPAALVVVALVLFYLRQRRRGGART